MSEFIKTVTGHKSPYGDNNAVIKVTKNGTFCWYVGDEILGANYAPVCPSCDTNMTNSGAKMSDCNCPTCGLEIDLLND